MKHRIPCGTRTLHRATPTFPLRQHLRATSASVANGRVAHLRCTLTTPHQQFGHAHRMKASVGASTPYGGRLVRRAGIDIVIMLTSDYRHTGPVWTDGRPVDNNRTDHGQKDDIQRLCRPYQQSCCRDLSIDLGASPKGPRGCSRRPLQSVTASLLSVVPLPILNTLRKTQPVHAAGTATPAAPQWIRRLGQCQRGSRSPMSLAPKDQPCTPDPIPRAHRSYPWDTIIIVIMIQVFTGFLIIRGFTLEAALAAAGGSCLLAGQFGHGFSRFQSRRIA